MTIQWSGRGVRGVPARGVPTVVPVSNVAYVVTVVDDTTALAALQAHIDDPTPHAVYDDSSEPDPVIVFENGLI